MHKAVASESWAARDPHTYADLKQSPRYPEAIRTPANTAEMVSRGAGLQPHSSAWHTQNGAEYSRKTVAESDAAQSQKFRRLFSTLLAVAILVHPAPASAHVRGCHSRKCDRRVSVKRHQHFWPHRFDVQPIAWQRWAHSTSWCESRDRRVARESGFYSYFQWTLQTWHGVGGSGNPETHSYAEQAVRAIRLARAHGTGSWPVCG